MPTVAIIIGSIIGVAVLALLFKPFFGGREDFFRCVKFWFTPDIISAFRGEYHEDWLAEMKLFLWLAAGAATGLGTYFGLMKLFG